MFGPSSPIDTAVGRLASCPAPIAARGLRARRARPVGLLAAALAATLVAVLAHHAPPRPLAPATYAGARAGLELLPTGARASVSATVGAGDPAFRVNARAHGVFSARNAGMTATFGRSGVSVVDGATRVQLQPLAIVAGGRQETLPARAPSARANEVSYAYPSLRAWYRNGPAGIEQGFVLTRPAPHADRHSGFAGSNLDLSLAVRSDALVRAARDGQSVSFTRAGAPALRLGSLIVSDARGRVLPSSFAVSPGALSVRIDASRARYPITIDPLFQEPTRLTGPGELGEGEFGLSVAVSGDGSTAIVAAPRDNNFAGAAWVFVRSGSTWKQQGAELLAGGQDETTGCAEEPSFNASEENECGFGAEVALSGDGNTAVIGSPRDKGFKGGAWVFTRSGSVWSREAAELTGEGEVGEGHFGRGIAISADGSVLLISAPADDRGRGAVWAFERSAGGWAPMGEGKITASDETGAGYFGRGLAISPDGSTAIVGAPGDNDYRGAVWMFTRSPSTWLQQGKVTGAEEQGESRFGFDVAASEGASVVLVGAPRDNGDVGATWVFTRSGDSLTEEGSKLTGAGEAGAGFFGRALAINASGSTALIGAPHEASGRGAAWVFTHSPSGWSSQKFSANDTRGQFGASIALSADGTVPVFGEPLSEHKSGVAWAGLPPADVTAVEPSSGPASGGTNVVISGAGFSEVTGVYFGSRPAIYEVRSSSSILALSPSGAGHSTVDVTVVTAHGTSEATAADRFTYIAREGGEGSEGGSGPGGGGTDGGGEDSSSGAEAGEEEGLGTLGLSASSVTGCRFALLSGKIAVLSSGRAAPRLRRLGTGRCAGKLMFTVSVKGKHGKRQARSIGSTRFAISVSSPVTVRVRLNSFGRALLRGGGGQVRARLVVVRLSPLPARAQSASVRLRLGH